jgi:DNA-directed RNA polymerase specialized sigma subunit
MDKPLSGGLQEQFEKSQSEVGEKLFLRQQTIAKIEQKAIERFKQELKARNIEIKDLLP